MIAIEFDGVKISMARRCLPSVWTSIHDSTRSSKSWLKSKIDEQSSVTALLGCTATAGICDHSISRSQQIEKQRAPYQDGTLEKLYPISEKTGFENFYPFEKLCH